MEGFNELWSIYEQDLSVRDVVNGRVEEEDLEDWKKIDQIMEKQKGGKKHGKKVVFGVYLFNQLYNIPFNKFGIEKKIDEDYRGHDLKVDFSVPSKNLLSSTKKAMSKTGHPFDLHLYGEAGHYTTYGEERLTELVERAVEDRIMLVQIPQNVFKAQEVTLSTVLHVEKEYNNEVMSDFVSRQIENFDPEKANYGFNPSRIWRP